MQLEEDNKRLKQVMIVLAYDFKNIIKRICSVPFLFHSKAYSPVEKS